MSMSDFRQLIPDFWVSPQIEQPEIDEAARRGFTLIVNNRPDGEADDQTPGAEIERGARAAGMDYIAIPIGQGGFGEAQVGALADAIAGAGGPVLAYCRSGTRSTLLWALAAARQGGEPARIAACAREAGYDVSPVSEMIELYSRQN